MKKISENERDLERKKQEEAELLQILQELDEDERLRDVEVPERVTQGLYAKIAEYKAATAEIESLEETRKACQMDISLEERFPDMSPEDIAIYRAGLEAKAKQEELEELEEIDEPIAFRRKRRRKKVYFLIAAVLILSLAMGTVGVGSSYKWLIADESDQGGYSVSVVESEDDIMSTESLDEQEAYECAKKLFGVSIVTLPIVEQGLEFDYIQVYSNDVGCSMFYYYQENIISYSMINNIHQTSYQEVQMGTLIEEYTMEVEENTITIQVYEEEDGKTTRKASFVKNNIYYSLKGAVKGEIFEEILKNLNFF